MTQQDLLRLNVVAVLCNGIITGTGFFVDRDGSILTCFHVVGDTSTGSLVNQQLSIYFNGVAHPVECIFRSFIPKKFDVAVLRLVSQALPNQAMLLPLGKWDADSMGNHTVVSYGYKLSRTFDGIYTRSTVVGRTPIELRESPGVRFLQLASEDLIRDEIGLGMSGAPVYHEETNQIVGMIVNRERPEKKDLAIPLALPIDEIARIWSPVRARLQQDELARQIRPLVSAHKRTHTIELLLQTFVNDLVRTLDFPAYDTLEGDKPQAAIEQLRSRGLIYDLFSYIKSKSDITGIPDNYFINMLSNAYTKGSEIKFINREEALALVDRFGPPYLLFDAPAGYGKTELLWEIEQRYLLTGWIFCYIETAQTSATALGLVQTLVRSANLRRLLPSLDDLQFSSGLIAAMLEERVTLVGAQGIVLLIDSIERLPGEERHAFRDHFLKHLIEAFTRRASGKKISNLRIVLAGRYLSSDWKKNDWTFPLEVEALKPFNYDVVLAAIRNSQWKNHPDPYSWAAHLVHLTGGHPRCIAESLPLMGHMQPIEENVASHQEVYRNVILPIINEVRSSIPDHLRDIFDRLSVFRRYNVRLLRSIIDAEVIHYENDAVKLQQELISTYLISRRNKFIQDEIVRRLLAIRLRWTDPELFLWLCERAKDIYQSDLDGMHSDPEVIMVEALYQELQLAYYQGKQDSEAREQLRQAFFKENGVLERNIRVLAAMPNLDNDDIKLNLKEMLVGKNNDWEFRFAVNFFLRADHYTDSPFEMMMRYIDQF